MDITAQVQEFVSGEAGGLVNISLPHATAGIVIIELGSGTERDLSEAVDRLVPREEIYRHSHGSIGHGADHVLPAFIAPTVTLPVIDGRVLLGTWQRIAVLDTNVDNPTREVVLSMLVG